MKALPKLYKRNTNGKTQEWEIYIDGNTYWSAYGQVGGKIQTDQPTTCQGKNIGRANETTPEEQALVEAQAKWKKQRDISHYKESIEEAEKDITFTVMLAKKYTEQADKLPDSVYISPKLDGLRCYITKDGAFSRNGKKWVATKYIESELEEFFKEHPNIILDGEIYNHDYHDNFNKIVSLAKKMVKIKDSDWAEIHEKLQYHIFDFYDLNYPSWPFYKRTEKLEEWFNKCNEPFNFMNILLVEQFHTSKNKVKHYLEKFMIDGYEGVMVRDPQSKYEQKRSHVIQKYKEFKDAEFEIVDIEEGRGNRSGMFGRAVLKHGDKTFEANARGNEEFYRKLFLQKDEFIGKMATVRYQNETPDGIPRFGVIVEIRNYE